MDKIPLEQKELNSSINPSHLSQLKLQQAFYSILPFCLSLGEDYFLSSFRKLKLPLCLLPQKLLWCLSLLHNVQMSLIKPLLQTFPELFLVKTVFGNYF